MDLSALAGKKVFVTGHTGFKGSWLVIWLKMLGAQVAGYSLAPPTQPSNFDMSNVRQLVDAHYEADIRNADELYAAIKVEQPDVIFHLAAQPLVRDSYDQPVDTFSANIMGTTNLLEAVRKLARPCTVVVVSSDKCYLNTEQVWGYTEKDALGGHDPYSASKAGTEIVTASYRSSFFNPATIGQHGIGVATARAGNVLGGGDWARDRIMTSIVSALENSEPILVRNPEAIRPWQHVLEPLSGYLLLASKMVSGHDAELYSAWNFGPTNASATPVRDIVETAIDTWGHGSWKDTSSPENPHEAAVLRLSIDKAGALLNWFPKWDATEAIHRTVDWHKSLSAGNVGTLEACEADIRAYIAA